MLAVTGWLLLLAQITVTEQAKLRPSGLYQGDHFGWSVDVRRDRIVAGADEYRHPTLGDRTGGAFVFELEGGLWKERALLLPSNVASAPSKLWLFGWAVACDSERVIVGALRASLTTGAYPRGLAFVYAQAGGTWFEEAILDPQEAQSFNVGWSVDIDGDVALVSGEVIGATLSYGVVYVFARSGSSWVKEATLTSPHSYDHRFGTSVSIRGDTAYIGSIDQLKGGGVYVFKRAASTWTLIQDFYSPLGKIGDWLGYSLAVDATTLVAGMPRKTLFQHGAAGGARIFELQGSTWLETQELIPKGYSAGEYAGWSVALDGDTLVLGMDAIEAETGSFYVYSRGPTGWMEQLEITSEQAKPGDQLGASVALDNHRLVLGAPGSNQPWDDTGATYVFDLQVQAPLPTYYCSAKQDSVGCVPRIFHFGQPSVSGTQQGKPYWVEAWDVQPVPGALSYSTTGAAAVPFHGGLLCILAPTRSIPAASSLLRFPPCNGAFTFDFNAWTAAGSDPSLVAGQPVWMQYWYRDPTGAPGNDVGLSQGIYVMIGP
jgi:hypothetical protein